MWPVPGRLSFVFVDIIHAKQMKAGPAYLYNACSFLCIRTRKLPRSLMHEAPIEKKAAELFNDCQLSTTVGWGTR